MSSPRRRSAPRRPHPGPPNSLAPPDLTAGCAEGKALGSEAGSRAQRARVTYCCPHAVHRIEPGWACRAKRERGAAQEMSPQPGAASSPGRPLLIAGRRKTERPLPAQCSLSPLSGP